MDSLIKRLRDEATYCNKNPHYCSIRTFDVLEEAANYIEELGDIIMEMNEQDG